MKPRNIPLLAFVGVAFISSAAAQERTAAGIAERQMNTATFGAKADAAKLAAQAVDMKVNQIATCGFKGLLYSPGSPNRDSQGCVKALIDDSAFAQLNAKLNSILACSGQGRIFNGTSCILPVTSPPRLQCRVAYNSGPAPHYFSRAECNGDEILTGGGAQSETIGTQLCSGQGLSYIHASLPSGNGWAVDGYRPEGGEACTAAYAICCKISN